MTTVRNSEGRTFCSDDYVVTRQVSTRWSDTDVYGHINTSVYIQLFDSAINGWLMEEAGYQPELASVIGVVAHYECEYHREVRFPDPLVIGLRVIQIGRTSVSFAADLFSATGLDDSPARIAAEAYWVHVYIDRDTRRPVEIPGPMAEFLKSKEARR